MEPNGLFGCLRSSAKRVSNGISGQTTGVGMGKLTAFVPGLSVTPHSTAETSTNRTGDTVTAGTPMAVDLVAPYRPLTENLGGYELVS